MSQATQAAHEHLASAEKETRKIFGPGGYLEQAQKAQAGGTLGEFIKQLVTVLGPIIGPLIVAFLQNLLPHVPPVPTPAPTK